MPLGALGMQAAGNAIDAVFGLALEHHNDKRQLSQQEKLQQLQIRGQKEMGDYNYEQQMRMWHDTNYSAQVDELRKAGLNPALMYGMSGGGGTTTGSQGGSVSGASAPSGGGEVVNMMGLQRGQTLAEIELIKAQTEKVKAEAEKTSGVDTELAKADAILKTVLGKDAQRQLDIKNPNREVETKTYQNELEARQGIAGTIYNAWLEGRLDKMNIEQLEQLVLQNAKTRDERREIQSRIDNLEANTKGKSLENMITELEVEMQKATGGVVDRNSPAWLRILGRLFTVILNK